MPTPPRFSQKFAQQQQRQKWLELLSRGLRLIPSPPERASDAFRGKKTCASWMFFLESGNCGALAARFFRCLQGSQTSGRAIFFFFFSKRRESICSVRGFCFFRLFLFPANHNNVSFLFKRRTGASADPGNLFDFFSLSFRLISHAIFARARQPNYSPTFPDFFVKGNWEFGGQ